MALENQVLVFCGRLSRSNVELRKLVEHHGAKVTFSVAKNEVTIFKLPSGPPCEPVHFFSIGLTKDYYIFFLIYFIIFLRWISIFNSSTFVDNFGHRN
jgi:hypothetical protein